MPGKVHYADCELFADFHIDAVGWSYFNEVTTPNLYLATGQV